MSQRTYNQLWADCHLELSRLLEEELPAEPLHPEMDRVVFFQRVAMLYVRYIQIFRKLNEIYDQVVHPQKRRFIHGILEGVMGRVLELKNEMVEKESSEYHYMDDILHDLKLTPGDIEIPIPRYFTSENDEEVQDRKMMAIDILNRLEDTKSTDADLEIPKPCDITSDNNEEDQERQIMFRHVQNPEEMTQDEAIRIIQIVERARKGRLRAHLQLMSKKQSVVPGAADMESAAIRIQKVWRGYTGRKQAKIMRLEEMIFLGMVMDPNDEMPCPAEIAVQANEASTRIKQEEHEKDYQKSIVAVTNRMLEVEGPDVSAMMKDQIRQWFIECRDATGSFPDYPNEEDGGSALIFVEKDPQELLEDMTAKNEEDPSKKAKGKEEETGQGKKNKANGDEEEEEEGLKMLPSAFLSDLEVGHKTYIDFWKNRDESTNFVQRHEVELIKEEKRKDIEAEIRKQVDVEMRKELDEWRLEVDNEKGGKAKGNAKKKKGSKSAKKKKKEKDLTSERTFESLCEELVEEGLLKMVKDIRMLEYLGDYSYLGTTLRQNDIEPMPSLSDVRQVLSLYGILPLGSQALHEKAPLIKAILLAGPAGVGKKMLVHTICRETGSNLFDLSPMNTAGKYPGKGGLAMMLHVVFKVARLLQPSLIWIEDTEKIFYKKVPKEEKELDPKRLKKDLLKCLKLIKAEDRVLIVGTTKDPMSADIKSFCKMYSKIILIPRPDYGARVLLWKELIKKQGGEITCKLDLSSLAKISDGYTPGHMVQVIQNVLTEQRVSQQEKNPLTAAEFVPPLVKIHPVLQDEEEALKNWYSKTPLGKKRIMLATGNEGEGVPATGKDAKKKKK